MRYIGVASNNEPNKYMTATNYHNETATFTVGQTVTHVTDDGGMVKGTVKALVAPDALEINFEDGEEGEEGTEKTNTCF